MVSVNRSSQNRLRKFERVYCFAGVIDCLIDVAQADWQQDKEIVPDILKALKPDFINYYSEGATGEDTERAVITMVSNLVNRKKDLPVDVKEELRRVSFDEKIKDIEELLRKAFEDNFNSRTHRENICNSIHGLLEHLWLELDENMVKKIDDIYDKCDDEYYNEIETVISFVALNIYFVSKDIPNTKDNILFNNKVISYLPTNSSIGDIEKLLVVRRILFSNFFRIFKEEYPQDIEGQACNAFIQMTSSKLNPISQGKANDFMEGKLAISEENKKAIEKKYFEMKSNKKKRTTHFIKMRKKLETFGIENNIKLKQEKIDRFINRLFCDFVHYFSIINIGAVNRKGEEFSALFLEDREEFFVELVFFLLITL